MSIEAVGQVVNLVLSLGALAGVFVSIGRRDQKLSEMETHMAALQARITTDEDRLANMGDVAGNIQQLRGKVAALEELRTVPQVLTQISDQLRQLQSTVASLDHDMRKGQTGSAVQSELVSLLRRQTEDLEQRMRAQEKGQNPSPR